MASNNVEWVPGDLVPLNFGSQLTRHDFGKDFIFGAATSSYQVVEGAYDQGRRGMSNWDAWSLLKPAKVKDGGNGCVAIDHYNLFREDVKLMKKMGLDYYRFSISWSRILPGGRLSAGLNREGVNFYNQLIDLLLEEDIKPLATIFHFDVPKCLEDEYQGFLDNRILQDFAEYAEVCFFEFGDRVKMWVTVNEPSTYTTLGYITGTFPPGHGAPNEHLGLNVVKHRHCLDIDQTCYGGDAATEPYIVAHNLILAHAKAVDIYRKKYQAVQEGKIGIVTAINWYHPYSTKPEDIATTERAIEFVLGWYIEPLALGHYPLSMQKRVGERLPKFSDEERELVLGSYDFIGLNYYTTNWAEYKPKQPGDPINYYTDQEVEFHTERNGVPIGPQAGSDWLFVVPVGIYELLTYAKKKYNDPIIYVTENGTNEKFDKTLPLSSLLHDDARIQYHQQHLAFVKLAMDRNKVNVKGYIVWALFDNYEWAEGYSVRFGMYYVDYVNGLTRYPKQSAIWFMNFLNKKKLLGPKRQVEEEKPVGKRKRN
ncbi:beta-glucosidase [Striga asiatica]|uniref:Beta-glucosidase n=1 Tax=Striga asiatica TaxID=4170 RepID=A0A5A7RIT5_STRAF|nr:beta-glucosidase [Striga asiatica]